MKWFKHYVEASSDNDLNQIYEETGLAGVGMYWMLMELVHSRNRVPARMLEMFRSRSFTMTKVERVLSLMDDVCLDKDGYITLCLVHDSDTEGASNVHASDTQSASKLHANSRKPMSMRVRDTRVKDVDIDIEKEEYKEEDIRAMLLSEDSMEWRQQVCMHSGNARLLMELWPEAVEFFISHSISQATLHGIRGSDDCKRYFSNFSKPHVGSGQALMAHLDELRKQRQARERDAGEEQW